MVGPITEAVFLDIPYLADSAWRHLEFAWNAELDYRPNAGTPPSVRPLWRKPPFWFFALVVMFTSYGPTWHGLCSVTPAPVTHVLDKTVGWIVIVASLLFLAQLWRKNALKVRDRLTAVAARLAAVGRTLSPLRRATVWAVTCAALLALAGAGIAIGLYLLYPDPDTRSCAGLGVEPDALEQLALCSVGIFAFAWSASRKGATLSGQIVAQGLILALIGALQWFWLSTSARTEASGLPYRHLFTLLAPLLCLVPLAALPVGAAIFQGRILPHLRVGTRGLSAATRRRFAYLLAHTELFVNRHDPLLNWPRIISALVYGPAYHPLYLLLPPALVALAAPAAGLYPAVLAAVFVSFVLLVWSNVSSRWQQIIIYVDRWFLSGTPLFVSLFVIVIGALRLAKVDYVSTLLDAAPFGTVFAIVAMNYLLFWLVEYWLNRVAAFHLLSLLGPVTHDLFTPYPLARPDPRVRVQQHGRVVASHGTGRFVALGTLTQQPDIAFQTYALVELFDAIGQGEKDHERMAEVSRRTGVYFFLLNVLIFAVLGAFVVAFLIEEYAYRNLADPVVTARQDPREASSADLDALLQRQAGAHRPALVIVASGGGTRAALYTASVLKGLHALGRDRDIVLVSGVSGGGVALAYFATHRGRLTGQSPPEPAAINCTAPGDQQPNVDAEWDCFGRGVAQAFIEDVLDGATEWRVFRHSSLSALLTESFAHRLLGTATLGDITQTALILNSAVVGHPQQESVLLEKTLDRPTGTDAAACDEFERPFSEMSGGRLIFTNLSNSDGFVAAPDAVPDVRLPYAVVNDRRVPVAAAAALNANFPPVFANARVRLTADTGGCSNRSYYVTDGGAEENLGLISALYALRSALTKIPNGSSVPTVHLVIAEASAVTYDYTQDRGLAAILGSRERLAGGLANALLTDISAQLRSRGSGLSIHDLPLPLAFRARGGFGTHWMYARQFELHDPRPRSHDWLNFFKIASASSATATVDRQALESLWSALHDANPATPFCSHPFDDANARNVKTWICGSADGATDVRDLHIEEWQRLVRDLKGGREAPAPDRASQPRDLNDAAR